MNHEAKECVHNHEIPLQQNVTNMEHELFEKKNVHTSNDSIPIFVCKVRVSLLRNFISQLSRKKKLNVGHESEQNSFQWRCRSRDTRERLSLPETDHHIWSFENNSTF